MYTVCATLDDSVLAVRKMVVFQFARSFFSFFQFAPLSQKTINRFFIFQKRVVRPTSSSGQKQNKLSPNLHKVNSDLKTIEICTSETGSRCEMLF